MAGTRRGPGEGDEWVEVTLPAGEREQDPHRAEQDESDLLRSWLGVHPVIVPPMSFPVRRRFI